MNKYVKTDDQAEYRESDNGRTILRRHKPSGATNWIELCVIPNGLKLLELKKNRTGSRFEALLSDNKWYEIGFHGGLTLTAEEREKMRAEEKRQKDLAKKQKEEEKEENENYNRNYYSSRSYSSLSSDEEEGFCKKLLYTIIPIIPIWWVIKLPFSIISWPVRVLCSSKNKNLLPTYSLKKF